ncbi:nucleoside-diphosphate-sugar epimerase [Streptosporangium becharense]|uniref:Nucleoside-diphosphate-sugar epimerase n=1 Tax=Streptosporangium becharense TaxID=1816182 RepID=A0A7W9IAX1_9ACTN|nr:NAD(P)H-binding protein [Streptosporangium becharense]MBB2915296.1 nucleoside-diphosphate-sugar epimerase [Streptosporangium becharense]MBB5817006.1 nucleoside-diphosphate-sugar epimerase [Streptosporangium becharense]
MRKQDSDARLVTGASGYIGGAVATRLLRAGHTVTGLTRDATRAGDLARLGIQPVVGSLDDASTLTEHAGRADAVVNAADSDHRRAVETLIAALAGSGKPLIHTSGSSIVGVGTGAKRPLLRAGFRPLHQRARLQRLDQQDHPREQLSRSTAGPMTNRTCPRAGVAVARKIGE